MIMEIIKDMKGGVFLEEILYVKASDKTGHIIDKIKDVSSEFGGEIVVEDEKIIARGINNISQIITSAITNEHAKIMLKDKIYKNYKKGKQEIYSKAVASLSTSAAGNIYHQILSRVRDYFEKHEHINLDGFINFRLKDYDEYLNKIAAQAAEEYAIDKEYEEFINLLKYFVEIGEAKEARVDIIILPSGEHIILDENKKDITKKCHLEFEGVTTNEEIKNDDLLISSLISISPNKIIIHNINNLKNIELIMTLQNVFAGRLVVCHGCELCGR
jgi:putative sporulation protein YtxC